MAVFSPLGTSWSRAQFAGPTAGISWEASAMTGAKPGETQRCSVPAGLGVGRHSVKILNLRRRKAKVL